MKPQRRSPIRFLVCLSLLCIAACSGNSPLGPSGSDQGIVLKGNLVGMSATSGATSTASSFTARSAAEIVVTVQGNPAIATTVGTDGSFALRGLPAGGFTLVFTQGGVVLGTLTFSGVLPNQEIVITVDMSTGTPVLIGEHRNGIGHGDIEIEGSVEQVLALNPTGDSRFLIHGYTVIARPGQTAIREGGVARTVEDVTVGRHVHVKGVWAEPEGQLQPVLAHEIVLQGDDGAAAEGACNIEGGRVGDRIELEGDVQSGNHSHFVLNVSGNRARAPVDVDASGATFECHPPSGPNSPSPDQCKATVKAGAKVHVSGRLDACTPSSASVSASKVIVQK